MANPYGNTLDDHSLGWAAAKGVPESVMPAILPARPEEMDEIVARLSQAELKRVINVVGRSPSCYPPGAYAALKARGICIVTAADRNTPVQRSG
jgi:hypothetical protein